MAPDPPPFTASVWGAAPAGFPVYRVVTDDLRVHYVAVPYKHSSEREANEVIGHVLSALRRPVKPLR